MSGPFLCVDPARILDSRMGIVVKVVISADGGRARTGAFGVAEIHAVIESYLSDGYALDDLEIEYPNDRPRAFHDSTDLARFVIVNEWALESPRTESGMAGWRETLNAVYDAWDADTPDDIVSTISAAIDLDRSYRVDAEVSA